MSNFEKFEMIFTFTMFPILCLVLGYIARSIIDNKSFKNKSTTENIIYNFLVGIIVFGVIMLANYIGCEGNIPMKPD